MPPRPRILVTTSTKPRNEGMRRFDVVGGLNFADAVVQAGGLPFFVPNVAAELAESYLTGSDGLLLAGGGDVDPTLFGQAPHPGLGLVDRARDALELALYHRGKAQGLPILGICRGLQLINVAEGGDLHQHLPALDHVHQHDQLDSSGTPLHPVALEPDSRLAAGYGARRIRSNSYHHQAIARLGQQLRAVGRSDDGVIEAIEGAGASFVLGVQWHPEMSFERFPEQFVPFRLFLDAVRERATVAP